MSNQGVNKLADQNIRSEFSRHWLLVLVCAVGIGVGVSALPLYPILSAASINQIF